MRNTGNIMPWQRSLWNPQPVAVKEEPEAVVRWVCKCVGTKHG